MNPFTINRVAATSVGAILHHKVSADSRPRLRFKGIKLKTVNIAVIDRQK
jgi:hypothetical protein